ncbi:hypothetical protein, partial [Frankia sp. AiPs1]|uniref:hypothetical protein n=1 Tax=Frankia sp. AiPs1 TaxID=573493 RepID=UPI002042F1D7
MAVSATTCVATSVAADVTEETQETAAPDPPDGDRPPTPPPPPPPAPPPPPPPPPPAAGLRLPGLERGRSTGRNATSGSCS